MWGVYPPPHINSFQINELLRISCFWPICGGGIPPTPEVHFGRAGGTSAQKRNLLIVVESVSYSRFKPLDPANSDFGTPLEIYNRDSSTWGVEENNGNRHSVNPKSRRKESG